MAKYAERITTPKVVHIRIAQGVFDALAELAKQRNTTVAALIAQASTQWAQTLIERQ